MSRIDDLVDAIESRTPGQFDYWTLLYVTEGGTLIIASPPAITDSGQPRDLVAVFPTEFGGKHLQPLWPALDPNWLADLERALVVRRG